MSMPSLLTWAMACSLLMLAFFRFKPISKQFTTCLWVSWAVRVLLLILLMPFEISYQPDALVFFEKALNATEPPPFLPYIFQGNANFLAINYWLLKIPGLFDFHALRLVYSFFGLISLGLLFSGLRRTLPNLPIHWLYFLGLFPGLIFWSGTLNKDIFVLFALCALVYLSSQDWKTKSENLRNMSLFLLVLISLYLIRFWTLLILIPFLLLAIAPAFQKISRQWKRIAITLLGLASLIFLLMVRSNLAIDSMESLLDRVNAVANSWSHGGSAQATPYFSSVSEFLLFLPQGAFTALFRPLPLELRGSWAFLAGLESLFLLSVLIYSFWQLRWRMVQIPLARACLMTLGLFSIFYSFVSYQNLGSAVRFRYPYAILILVLFMLSLTSKGGEVHEPVKA